MVQKWSFLGVRTSGFGQIHDVKHDQNVSTSRFGGLDPQNTPFWSLFWRGFDPSEWAIWPIELPYKGIWAVRPVRPWWIWTPKVVQNHQFGGPDPQILNDSRSNRVPGPPKMTHFGSYFGGVLTPPNGPSGGSDDRTKGFRRPGQPGPTGFGPQKWSKTVNLGVRTPKSRDDIDLSSIRHPKSMIWDPEIDQF